MLKFKLIIFGAKNQVKFKLRLKMKQKVNTSPIFALLRKEATNFNAKIEIFKFTF